MDVDLRYAYVWRFREGRVIHFESFLDREQALEAAGLWIAHGARVRAEEGVSAGAGSLPLRTSCERPTLSPFVLPMVL
jgi:hypothetical protein